MMTVSKSGLKLLFLFHKLLLIRAAPSLKEFLLKHDWLIS